MEDSFWAGKIAAFSRIFLCILQAGFSYIGHEYDSSSVEQSFLSHHISTRHLSTHLNESKTTIDRLVIFSFGGLTKWDAVYFLNIASFGYEYEQMLAFFPAFPIIVSYVAKILQICALGFITKLPCLMLSVAFINILVFSAAAVSLHRLTLVLTRNRSKADVTVLLFCCNPASVFHLAAYSESLFACFQFTGMLWIERRDGRLACFVSALCFAVASATRSNGLLSAGFIIYPILIEMVIISRRTNGTTISTILYNAKDFCIDGLTCIASILIAASPFLYFQYFAYTTFCKDLSRLKDSKDHWCFAKFPSSYSYIQSTYWNVGPFRYFQLKQIPNFALALPVVVLSICAVFDVLKPAKNGLWVFMLMILKPSDSVVLVPYACHLLFLVLFGIINIHVQVLTRMVFAANPLILWYAADILMSRKDKPKSKYFTASNIVLGYFVSYALIGILLHCNFYPWT